MKPIDKIELAKDLEVQRYTLNKVSDKDNGFKDNQTNVHFSDDPSNYRELGLPLEYQDANKIQNNQEALMIDFGVWLSGNYNTTNKEDEWFCSNDTPMGNKFTTKQLFELYQQRNLK